MKRLGLMTILILFGAGAALALPTVGLAYTVVLKDGTKIEAKEKPRVQAGMMVFIGTDGKNYRLPVLEVDSPATRVANGDAKSKRVWTNEEVGSSAPASGQQAQDNLEPDSRAAASPDMSPSAERDNAGHDRGYYQSRLRALRAQIHQIDEQIKKYNDSKGLTTWITPEGGAWWNLHRTDPTIKLQEQKKEIQKKIDEVEEEARRNGAPAGWTRE